MNILKQQKGFTLIELMISMAVGGIVMAAVMTSFFSQHETYLAQDEVVEMQQNARIAMDMLAHDIRTIGYDPDNRGAALTTSGIDANGTASTLTFTRDDETGGLETIEYSLYDAFASTTPPKNDGNVDDLALKITDKSGVSGGRQPIAENINQLEFRYLDEDGNPTSTLTKVRSIQISMLVQSSHWATKSPPPSRNYTTPAGVTWSSDNGYRSLFLTSTIYCRNLGL